MLLDPGSPAVRRVIVLQHNPDTLSRTLQVQAMGSDGNRSEALRSKVPRVENIKLDAEIEASDQLQREADDQAVEPMIAIHHRARKADRVLAKACCKSS